MTFEGVVGQWSVKEIQCKGQSQGFRRRGVPVINVVRTNRVGSNSLILFYLFFCHVKVEMSSGLFSVKSRTVG